MPLIELNALTFLSIVPVAKTKFPAVAVAPPIFKVPVFGIPIFFNSEYSPKGTCQIILPEFKFKEVKVPHGGFEPGYPF